MVLGILAKLLAPIVALILAVTGIGLLVLPFLLLALFVVLAIKKPHCWYGSAEHRPPHRRASVAKAPGALPVWLLLLTLFYMVWVVGFLAYIWFSIWAWGSPSPRSLRAFTENEPRLRLATGSPGPVRVLPLPRLHSRLRRGPTRACIHSSAGGPTRARVHTFARCSPRRPGGARPWRHDGVAEPASRTAPPHSSLRP